MEWRPAPASLVASFVWGGGGRWGRKMLSTTDTTLSNDEEEKVGEFLFSEINIAAEARLPAIFCVDPLRFL